MRMRWQDAANGALENAGSDARIDMRSYADRGTGEAPTPYLLPSEWRDPAQRGSVVAAREANAEVRAAMPDMGAEDVDLMAKYCESLPLPDEIENALVRAFLIVVRDRASDRDLMQAAVAVGTNPEAAEDVML